MKYKRNKFPFVLGVIGAILNLISCFAVAYFALGGVWFNGYRFDFGAMSIVIAVMAIAGGVIGVIASAVAYYSPLVGGVMMLVGLVEYVVCGFLIGQMWTIPYLVLGGIGTTILWISSLFIIVEAAREYFETTESKEETRIHTAKYTTSH